jgi:hypothetical protein
VGLTLKITILGHILKLILTMKFPRLIFLIVLLAISCKTDNKAKPQSENPTENPNENEWIALFDGTSTEGWRAYNGKGLPPQCLGGRHLGAQARGARARAAFARDAAGGRGA